MKLKTVLKDNEITLKVRKNRQSGSINLKWNNKKKKYEEVLIR